MSFFPPPLSLQVLDTWSHEEGLVIVMEAAGPEASLHSICRRHVDRGGNGASSGEDLAADASLMGTAIAQR